MPVTPAPTQDLLEVPLSTIRIGVAVPFPLYSLVQGERLLLRKEGDVFLEEHYKQARAMGIRQLFAPREALAIYLTYLNDTLASLVDDDKLDPEEKMDCCYRAGIVATDQVLTDPSSEMAMASARQFVRVCTLLFEKHTYTFTGLRKVMDQNPTLSGHSVNVCLYGLLLGRSTGYSLLDDLGLALLLHDVGLLAISEETLAKMELDRDDWKEIKKHPALGVTRTACAPRLPVVARDVIQNHHERLDGSGYPRGLFGSQLSVATRIAAIVNAFDSRTSNRHYRAGRSAFDVLEDMLFDGRDEYDPTLLRTFIELLAT